MHCHGGFNQGEVHGDSAYPVAGYQEGRQPGASANVIAFRFMNGGSWQGHYIITGSTNPGSCYTLTGTKTGISACTSHGGGRAESTKIYAY